MGEYDERVPAFQHSEDFSDRNPSYIDEEVLPVKAESSIVPSTSHSIPWAIVGQQKQNHRDNSKLV